MMDLWSRKVVGWTVHEMERSDFAAELFVESCQAQQVDPAGIVLHADNGGPTKGAAMIVTLERPGGIRFLQPSRCEQ